MIFREDSAVEDFEKMKQVQERISELLKFFKANSVLPKSKIMKYYKGLDVTYDEFVEQIEKSLLKNFSEKDSIKLSELLEEL